MDFARNNDLIAYNGAWIYPVEDGWQANLRGFHYSADTQDELKAKIDMYNDDNEHTFKLATSTDYAKPVYGSGDRLFEEDEEEDEDIIQWSVQYNLPDLQDYDDDIDGKFIEEVIIEAPDFRTATKYAEQYARVEAHENDSWSGAEIISIAQK